MIKLEVKENAIILGDQIESVLLNSEYEYEDGKIKKCQMVVFADRIPTGVKAVFMQTKGAVLQLWDNHWTLILEAEDDQ